MKFIQTLFRTITREFRRGRISAHGAGVREHSGSGGVEDLFLVLERPGKQGAVKMHLEGAGAQPRRPEEVLPESFVAFLNSSDGVVDFIHEMSNLTAHREKNPRPDEYLDLPPEDPVPAQNQVRIKIIRPHPSAAGSLHSKKRGAT